jgi:hypothetical protein
LKSDGTIVGWGDNSYGQAAPPSGNHFVAISARQEHSLALRADGSIAWWGRRYYHNATPPSGNDFVAVSAGGHHSLALRTDGSIAGWGRDNYGQATPPEGNDFVAISAGWWHSLGLKADGSIAGWGRDHYGQATPPEGNDFVAISAGEYHSLALKADGSVVGWGRNNDGEASLPDGNDFVAISAGYNYSLAIKEARPIEAEIKLKPDTLNLQSKGRWIMCVIRLAQDYNVTDIDRNSILLEDEIEAERVWLGDEFAVAKFSRGAVQELLADLDTPTTVELLVSGQLNDGTIFEGTDTIRIVRPERKRILRRRRVGR